MLFIKGFLIGLSNIIPGFSGGTMLLILGVYHLSFLHIKQLFHKATFLSSLYFLIPLFLGALSAIYMYSWLSDIIFSNSLTQTILYAYCIGLVSGTIYKLIQFIYIHPSSQNALKKTNLKLTFLIHILGIIWAIFFYFILAQWSSQWEYTLDQANNGSFTLSKGLALSYLWLSIASFLASLFMLLPGLSGSLFLIQINLYFPMLNFIQNMQLIPLLFCAIGSGLGLIFFYRFFLYAFLQHTHLFYSFIVPFLLFSLYPLWEKMNISLSYLFILAIISFSLGYMSSTQARYQAK